MPIKPEYKSSDNYLLATVDGILRLHEHQQILEEITSSKEYPPNLNIIWDVRKIDLNNVNTDFEQSLIHDRKTIDKERGNANVAIVVGDDLSFGLSRMYQTLSEISELSREIKIFKNI